MLVFIIAATSLWVYLDATKHKIGKTDAGGMFNISAGAWSVCTLLFWIVALPAYLIKRGALKAIAAEKPVEVRMRGFKAFIIAILGFGWFVTIMYADYLTRMGQL